MAKWQLTDYDNQQYGRCMAKNLFQFKEFNRRSYNLVDELQILGEAEFIRIYFNLDEYWLIDIINLKQYSDEQKRKYCASYYTEKEFDQLTDWIIAECIFEQENGLY
ncbi:MAG: hypothetical protein WC516_06355 [Patescibacteria group bacterium]